MRGNEVLDLRTTAIPTNGFPIPMRGNEVLDLRSVSISTDEFPIPMRGNENEQKQEVARIIQVPNPHEG